MSEDSRWLLSVPIWELGVGDMLVNRLLLAGVSSVGDVLDDAFLRNAGLTSREIEIAVEAASTLAAIGMERIAELVNTEVPGIQCVPRAPSEVLVAISEARNVLEEIVGLTAGLSTRDRSIVLRRWALMEASVPTLETIAAAAGVTRERVRQITSRCNDRVTAWGLRLPRACAQILSLDANGSFVDLHTCTVGMRKIYAALVEVGKLGVCPQSAVNRDIAVWAARSGMQKLVEAEKGLGDVRKRVRRQLRMWGAFWNDESCHSEGVPGEIVVRMLCAEWAEAVRWESLIIVPDRRSMLARLVGKVLSVSARVPLNALAKGLERHVRFDNPGADAVAAIIRAGTFAECDGEEVRPRGRVEDCDSLTRSERSAVTVIDRAGGVIDSELYVERMAEQGVRAEAASAILRQPFITHLERGVYGLIGERSPGGPFGVQDAQEQPGFVRVYVKCFGTRAGELSACNTE